MNIWKQKNRLEKIDLLLRQKNTGSSFEFADKIGISRTTLMDIIAELRSLGFPIIYDYYRKSYIYKSEGHLVFGFTSTKIDTNEMNKIKGGAINISFEETYW